MRSAPLLLSASAILLAACGSDPVTPGGGGGGNAPMSASVNGTQWGATTAAAVRVAPGTYSITAIRTATPNYSMIFQLYNIGGASTYPLGAGPQIFGGAVTVSNPSTGSWSTPLTGAAGSITISTLTDTRMAGTFEYNASGLGSTTSSLSVTSGTFDIPVTGTASALPDNAGNKVTATINGASFAAAAASVSLASGASPTLLVLGSNTERTISISIANMTAAGSYTLGTTPIRTIQVTNLAGGSPTWGSQVTGGSGSVTVTSVTATRVIGTFTATLAPLLSGATGNLTVSGSFNMGR